jgi:formylglycine-generating enzyme required for sulfatase activity
MDEGRFRTFKSLAAILIFGFAGSFSTTVLADPSGETLQQMVDQLRSHPDDKALRERIVKAAREQTPAPAVPEEARRFFIRGNTALEDAQGQDGYLRAIRNYSEAIKIAPWWGDAYHSLAKARDLAKDYPGAIDALGLYLLTGPAQADARQAQDRIYALEEKQDEKRERAPEQPAPAAAAAAAAIAAPAATVEAPVSVKQETPVQISTQETTRRPGTVFRDCSDCPEMVVVNPSYAMGKYLVTQKLWRDVMGSNPSFFPNCGDDCPVEHVSWKDIQEFLAKLNQRIGKSYGLPTEAQWEAACHAASPTEFCGGRQADAVAWFLRNSGAKTHPVGQKKPNDLGLYDMNGDVWEWTNDCSDVDCLYRVLRGGSWTYDPQFAGSKKRIAIDSSIRLNDYGFRLVRTLP